MAAPKKLSDAEQVQGLDNAVEVTDGLVQGLADATPAFVSYDELGLRLKQLRMEIEGGYGGMDSWEYKEAKRRTEISAKLKKPFPRTAVKQRSQGGKDFDYIEGHTAINRLIEATDNQFDVKVVGAPWETTFGKSNNRALCVVVEVTIEGLGTRSGIGVAELNSAGSADQLKGAVTDGMKKAASQFNMAAELYGEDYEAVANLREKFSQVSKLLKGQGIETGPQREQALRDRYNMDDFSQVTMQQYDMWIADLIDTNKAVVEVPY